MAHIKSHYTDKDLVKKEYIAKDMIHLNYESVLEITSFNQQNDDARNSITHRKLQKVREKHIGMLCIV
jgi:hypothetical protein